MKLKSRLVVWIAVIILGRVSLWGQVDPNIEQGMKPYGSFEGSNIDSVSLTNGNLTIHQPLWSTPQRGNLGATIDLIYNNKSFTATKTPTPCGGTHPPCGYTAFWHGTGVSLQTGEGFGVACQMLPSNQVDQLGGTVNFNSCIVSTPDGSQHLLADTGNGYSQSIDGSGFRYYPATSTSVDATGVVNTNQVSPVLTDANGNHLSGGLSNTGGAVSDTLGHSIPQSITIGDINLCPNLGYSFQSVNTASNWNFAGPSGTTTLLMCFANVQVRSSFWNLPGSQTFHEATGTSSMLQSIVLPDKTFYAFKYDAADPNNSASIAYGDLLKMTLPTGGSISYTWTTTTPCSSSPSFIPSRVVTSRIVDANDGNGSQTWSYSLQGAGSVVVTDPLGKDTVHIITGLGGTCSLYETETDFYDGPHTGGTLLKTVKTDYSFTGNPYDMSAAPNTVAGVVPIHVTTILPNGQQSRVETDYDSGFVYRDPLYGNPNVFPPQTNTYTVTYGRPVAKREYDWGQGVPGALLRQTLTTYQWQVGNNYDNDNFRDLPFSVKILDGANHLCAETDYTYDVGTPATSNISTAHGAAPGGSIRGNLTTVKRKLSTTPCATNATWSDVISGSTWFDTGELQSSTDPGGHTTNRAYDVAYQGAYSTQTCSPSTSPGSITHCVTGTYDFNTGLLTSFTNENATQPATGNNQGDPNHTKTFTYDNMLRMTHALAPPDPGNNSAQQNVTFTYPPAPVVFPETVIVQKLVTPAISDNSTVKFDGLGRVFESDHTVPGGIAKVVTVLDGLSQTKSVTNPYFTTADPTYGITQSEYDALGRVTKTIPQDGTSTSNNIGTDYSNFPMITVTDQVGNQRRSRTDGLGRLVEVDEPGSGANGPSTAGAGSVSVSGTLHSTPNPGVKATGYVDISGTEISGTFFVCFPDGSSVRQHVDDSGSVSITVNGTTTSVSYGLGSTSSTVATALAGALNGGSLVQASASGSRVNITAQIAGPNYSLSATSASTAPTCSPLSSFSTAPSGAAMTGGVAPSTTYDSGTLTVTVNGFQGSAAYNQNLNSNPTALATALASALNVTGSPVTASASGASITLKAKTTGLATNYSVTGSSTASFTASNTTLSGGSNAGGLFAPLVTYYSYDALGNLLRVEQRGVTTDSTQWRVRTFTYDSLGRLLTAQNPESGTITYSYDADGNLLQKMSPAPNQTPGATQTVSYCYDALHRVTGRGYGAQSCPLTTPVVTYAYDSGTNAKGKLTSLTDQAGTASYTYDILGRLATETRTLTGANNAAISKNLSYEYNLDGSLKTLHYPSGAAVTYTPDSAGRILSAIDSGNGINYVTGATYGPDSTLIGFLSGYSATFAGITNAFSYNKRLQPLAMSAAAPSQTVFSIGYDFHLGNGDNGNVFGITNYKDNSRNQSFTYDALNRLTSAQNAGTNCAATTVNGKTEYWGNNYGYDAWGNLTAKSVTKCSAENFSVAALTNNQLSGYSYDAAGNMTNDPTEGITLNYDQENRITGASGYTYAYDGDSNRVKKSNGTTGTLYWYMTPGIVAESDLSGALKSEYVFFDGERVARKDFPGNSVAYYFSDHLKTASVITDSAGNIKSEDDYYPWGGELQFVNNDSNHYKYGGHERDGESGLDYQGARYYSNGLGRFVTPDWSATPVAVPYADLTNPQTLNQYAYVGGNPASKTDPDGHCPDGGCTSFLTAQQSTDSMKFLGGELVGVGKAIINAIPKTYNAAASFINAQIEADPQMHDVPLMSLAPTLPVNGPAEAVGNGVGELGIIAAGGAKGNPSTAAGQSTVSEAGAVSKVDSIVNSIDKGGFKVTQNAKSATQEGNVTITHPSEPGAKLNLRSETHPLDNSGQSVPHVNVERVTPRTATQPKTVKNTHITD